MATFVGMPMITSVMYTIYQFRSGINPRASFHHDRLTGLCLSLYAAFSKGPVASLVGEALVACRYNIAQRSAAHFAEECIVYGLSNLGRREPDTAHK